MSKETPKDDPHQQSDHASHKQTDKPWKGNPEKEQRNDCWFAAVRKHRARFESCVNLFPDHQAGFRFGIHLAGGNAPKTNIDYVIAFNGQH
jgi:hypothetical protein